MGILTQERIARSYEALDRGEARHYRAESDRVAEQRTGWRPPPVMLGPWPLAHQLYPDRSQHVWKDPNARCTLPHTDRRCWYCGAEPTTEAR